MRRITPALLAVATLLLAGCDQLGIESATAVAAKKEAEGKAVGAGCRHAARSVEQCYDTNKRADKAAVFAGWREMNDYMRENKIEPQPAAAEPATAVAAADEHVEDEPSGKGEGGKGAKAEKADRAPAKKH